MYIDLHQTDDRTKHEYEKDKIRNRFDTHQQTLSIYQHSSSFKR